MTFSFKKITLMFSFFLTTLGCSYGNIILSYVDIDDPYSCCAKPQNCGKFFFQADFLYWRAYESGLDECFPTFVSDTMSPTGQIISVFNGKGRDPHFNWNPGFRLATAYQLPNSNWDFAASWTYFHSTSRHFNGHPNTVRWNINLDVVDLLAAYRYVLNHSFTLRPFAGMRGAIINQKLKLGIIPNAATFATPIDPTLIGVRNKEYFWGVGPLFGLEADWHCKGGVSLYANGSISWLYGCSNLTLVDSENTVSTIDYSHIKNNFDDIITVADAGFGIRWKTIFWNDKSFSVNLGFEHHHYFDYNRLGARGNLSFDGIELGLGFEF